MAILNDENYPTELIGSGNSKPVIGILASKDFNLAEFEELEAKLEAKSDQFYAELIESGNSKPVIAILALGGDLPILKAKAEKFYGDKYKIVTGIIQEYMYLYSYLFDPMLVLPPGVFGSKNGEIRVGGLSNSDDPTQEFKSLKEALEKIP